MLPVIIDRQTAIPLSCLQTTETYVHEQARAGRPVANTSRSAVDRRAGSSREREKEKEAIGVVVATSPAAATTSSGGGGGSSSKSKGMTCRFCGKVFTHAPAHLQHERAHLQQQETKNP